MIHIMCIAKCGIWIFTASSYLIMLCCMLLCHLVLPIGEKTVVRFDVDSDFGI